MNDERLGIDAEASQAWLLDRLRLLIDGTRTVIVANETLLEAPGHREHAEMMLADARRELDELLAEEASVRETGSLPRTVIERIVRRAASASSPDRRSQG